MGDEREFGDEARQIIDANPYLTLATADGDGRPWASPVWFAHDAYAEFLWMSRPGARHSRNVAARPEIGFVVFDSTVVPGTAQALYVDAVAEEVGADEVESAIAAYSARSEAQGIRPWRIADVVGSAARHRLYRARARSCSLLSGGDRRIAVDLTTT
jgi:nitroimidazol reductase NimA-like FMN-containing flavoprotein (pyridoxamine 5'-phosphate oxidase superfamily)